jgi:hypothetical protein
MSFQIGDTIGDYAIIGVLGAGGMGSVYKVRNLISDRTEAMKILLPNLKDVSDLADRFQREIKVQGRAGASQYHRAAHGAPIQQPVVDANGTGGRRIVGCAAETRPAARQARKSEEPEPPVVGKAAKKLTLPAQKASGR